MKDVLVGTAASRRVEFETPLGELVADNNSVFYSIYDHTGSLIRGPVALPGASGQTGATIPLLTTDHTIDSARRFEKRKLIVFWTSSGESYLAERIYRVIPNAPYTVSPDRVRALLGFSADELTDDEIDVLSAYLTVSAELGASALSTALATGTIVEDSANELIAVTAALAVVSSLPIRTPMVQADGSKRWERFRTAPNWDALRNSLAARRADLVADVTGTTVGAPSLVVLTTPMDVITGV